MVALKDNPESGDQPVLKKGWPEDQMAKDLFGFAKSMSDEDKKAVCKQVCQLLDECFDVQMAGIAKQIKDNSQYFDEQFRTLGTELAIGPIMGSLSAGLVFSFMLNFTRSMGYSMDDSIKLVKDCLATCLGKFKNVKLEDLNSDGPTDVHT